ncbi:unnamed protein product [Durusdinium trenchii]|uniref:SPX domain-containing protein n=1 Tax=Durusdinium trenchii TaxID=1381693 RepID=A0ABP0PC22_9DINO
MKFGKQIKRLADPADLNHYLAYDVLKKAINVVAPSAQQENEDVLGKSAQPAESRFYELLQHEMSKVNRFFQLQLRTLLDKFREVQRALHSMAQGGGSELLTHANRLLEEAADGLVELDQFKYLNFTGFRKIAKKFDKSTKSGVTLSSWFMPQLKRAFFVAHPLDGLLLSLSLGYAAVRRFQSGRRSELATGMRRPPKTMTFCLAPLGRMRSLCTLVKSFQLVLPPHQGHVASEGMSGEELSSELQKLLYALGTEGLHVPCRIATQMTAEYFDSPEDGFPFYQSHLQASAGEGCLGFRCRQTGERGEVVEVDGAGSSVGINAFTAVQLGSPDAFPLQGEPEMSSLERLRVSAEATLKKSEAKEYVTTLGDGGCRELASFASQVAGACSSYRLETVATIGASRLLLRGDTDATSKVCIAMDEEVQFARAPGGQVSDAMDFAYCMLEVSGENLSDAKWLEELRGDAALREAPGFNVGVQAIAALHKDLVPSLPHWYDVEDSFAKPEEFGLALQRRADEWQAQEAREEARHLSSAHEGPPMVQPVPTMTEAKEAEAILQPKDLLASERTMLEWMHTVFALAVIAIGLWRYSLTGNLPKGKALAESDGIRKEFFNTSSSSRMLLGIYSLFLVFVAVCFGWYAVLSHLQRIKALTKNDQKERIFNRRTGPTLFAGCMALALVAHLALQLA